MHPCNPCSSFGLACGGRSRLITRFPPVDFVVIAELFFAYTGKEGDPTYMKSSDGSSNKREVAEA